MVPAAMKLQRRYGELSMPISIIAGTSDRVVTTQRQSARLHRELPASHFQTVAGAGHMVHHVAPDIILAAIFKAALPGEEQRRPVMEAREAPMGQATIAKLISRLSDPP